MIVALLVILLMLVVMSIITIVTAQVIGEGRFQVGWKAGQERMKERVDNAFLVSNDARIVRIHIQDMPIEQQYPQWYDDK